MTSYPTRQALLSPQVASSRYFFLDLGARRQGSGSVVLGGREHCNPDYHLIRARYPYSVFEYVAEGEGWVRLDGAESRLGPGSIFVSGPRTHCELVTDSARPLTKYFLCLTGPALRRKLRAAALGHGLVRRLAVHGEIRSVCEEIVREGGHAGERTAAVCEHLFEILLLKIQDAAGSYPRVADAARDNFLRCKAAIDADAETIQSLDGLSASLGIEASSICRLFRRFQGTSPYQYLLRRKMNLAAEYLLGSGMLVKEASQRVGFADPYHFSRCFKAVHGVSPSDLRRG